MFGADTFEVIASCSNERYLLDETLRFEKLCCKHGVPSISRKKKCGKDDGEKCRKKHIKIENERKLIHLLMQNGALYGMYEKN